MLISLPAACGGLSTATGWHRGGVLYVSLDGEHYRKEGVEIPVRDFYRSS